MPQGGQAASASWGAVGKGPRYSPSWVTPRSTSLDVVVAPMWMPRLPTGSEAYPSMWDTLRSEEGAQPASEGGFLPLSFPPPPPPMLLSKGLYGGD